VLGEEEEGAVSVYRKQQEEEQEECRECAPATVMQIEKKERL